MHPHRLYHLLSSSSSSSSPHLVIFLLIFVNISLAQDDKYTICGRPFQCGSVNATFPFWGQNRSSYCGHPDFELDCENDIPSMKDTQSQKYRILDINNQTKILNIVSMGILEGTCPTQSSNINNFPPSFFEFAATANQVLTLLSGCTALNLISAIGFTFTCSEGGDRRDLFITGFNNTTTPTIETMGNCSKDSTVVVSVLQTAAIKFLSSNPSSEKVKGVLTKGFELRWIIDGEPCKRCVASGGQCGYDTTKNIPVCFCSDGSERTTCDSPAGGNRNSSAPSPPQKKRSNALSVGLGVGISAFGVIFLLCFFLMYRRRRRNKLRQLPSSSSPILLSNKSISSKTISKIDMDYEEGSNNFTGVQIFTYSELDEATDHFDASKELGDGGFGTVYYGVLKDGRQVAVKRLFENNYKRVEQFMNEVEILTRMRHQNLVTLYGSTSHNSRELILVYEFVANGTVADHLHGGRSKPGQLKWPSRMNIAMESAGALTYLHASDIIHRDVKTTNILLDKNFGVKVADFGLSRLFPTNVTHVSTAPQGTPGYVDPEYYQCYQITDKSDVYSFGVVLIELISSKPAVDTNRHRYEINLASMAINKIRNGELHEMVDPYLGFESDQIVRRMIISVAELAFRCLQQQREMRPSMAEVWEVLKGIKSEVYKMENADVVDIPADDIGLLDDIRTISLESTTTTSKSTTPNTSSSSA